MKRLLLAAIIVGAFAACTGSPGTIPPTKSQAAVRAPLWIGGQTPKPTPSPCDPASDPNGYCLGSGPPDPTPTPPA